MSLDPGNSSTFAVHVNFLGTGRWGLENVANLGQIPPRGATVFVGVIPWEEGSGGPGLSCRAEEAAAKRFTGDFSGTGGGAHPGSHQRGMGARGGVDDARLRRAGGVCKE